MTLIEILVVMGIIGVLAVMLSTMLQPALRRSQSAKCLSNLKQIGAVILQYTYDHNGYLPTPGGSSDTNIAMAWPQALMTYDLYLKSDALICPSDPDPNKKANGYSYAMNGNLVANFNSTNSSYDPLALLRVKKPSQMILFADSIASRNGRSVGISSVQYLHNKRFNAVFLDGHATAIDQTNSVAEIWNPKSQ